MRTLEYLWSWLTDAYNFTGGMVAGILGYFLPIKNIIHLVLLLFLLDVIIGYIKAHKVDKEKFKPRLIWRKTVPRVLFVIIIIMLLYLWDTVFHQDIVKTYTLVGWFISGLLIVSVVENMYIITNWRGFTAIDRIIKRQILTKTNENIDDYETKRIEKQQPAKHSQNQNKVERVESETDR